MRRMAEIIS